MALAESSEAYKQLREIVGDENITVDPVVMDTYLWRWLGDPIGEKGNSFMPVSPEAVVLPGSTREVQQAVKVCNRFGLKFKARSTGWISFAAPMTEGVVLRTGKRSSRTSGCIASRSHWPGTCWKIYTPSSRWRGGRRNLRWRYPSAPG